MDVLHVVHCYYPGIGGSERLIQRVSEKLHARYGDRVTVCTTNAYNTEAFVDPSQPLLPPGEFELNGVRVKRFAVFNRLGKPLFHLQRLAYKLGVPGNQYLRTLYGGPIAPGLRRCVEDFDGDVVTAASFPLLHMYTTSKACQHTGKPLVLVGALHPLDDWGYGRPMIYRAIERADAYIALSDYERDYLIGTWGVSPDRTTVIGAGVDPGRFLQANGAEFRQSHHLDGLPLVAFIGPQGKNKGLDNLVLAMHRVWEDMPEVRLLIAGAATHFTPHLEAMIRARLPRHQQAKIIHLHGFTEAEKPGLFAACNVFVYPSRYESFGLAFVEAWAAGKPVIGCDAGAVASLIDDGIDGVLVPPDDVASLGAALLRLLRSPDLSRQMGQAGRRKVQRRYTWDEVTSRWRKVYERVLHGHPGTP